ncbi:autotransporter outer membrane beta-barrel domain-containing protein [Novosphingobium naphthalenivorans]|uniref:autotransporter outer membrane beta-barrel domain-containing protein n=1 Tax=Novosphingobium naphthalenivorans TaxID=273168 RepID=UPI000B0FEAB9|nr:autotransporter outer membrane beta-barrel domain-containing protein [Novosphingobium naphthalenivorans]
MTSPAHAQSTSDPAGDFLSTYTGPLNGDLDVTSIQATFDGATFRLDATTAAPIGTTATGLYVWGFDRGKGTAAFAQIGATNVLFDSVIIVNPGAGTVVVRDIVNNITTVLPASAIKVSGNEISVEIPANLLSPEGFAQAEFLVNLWPRNVAGGDETISDFAPDNSDVPLILAFPTPVSASVQTELVFDDANDRFDRIQRRLYDQRAGIGSYGGIGGFIDVGARFGNRGVGGSLARDTTNRVLSVGIDYAIGSHTVLGIAFAADKAEAALAYGGSLKADILSPEIYAGYSTGAFHAEGYASYSAVSYDSRRVLPIGGEALIAAASPDGHAFSYGASLGYDLGGKALTFTPLADILVTTVHVDAYSEANDYDFGSAVSARDRTSARLGLGAQIAYAREQKWGRFALHAKARYVTELADKYDVINFAYTARANEFRTLDGPVTGVDFGTVELGADIVTKGGAAPWCQLCAPFRWRRDNRSRRAAFPRHEALGIP